MEFNFYEEQPLDKVTLDEFRGLCEAMFKKRKEMEEKEIEVKALNEHFELLKRKALEYLEKNNLEKFHVPGFGTVGTRKLYQVKMPKDPEKHTAFLDYLDREGLGSLLSVNHQTLNAWYREKSEEIIGSGESLTGAIPGLDEPQVYTNITMRKDAK